MQNHLTELLDERLPASYSERTLQPGRTPGRGLQGVRRGSRRGKEAGGPQIRLLDSRQEWRASREGPGAAAGAFSFGAPRPLRLPGHAFGVRGLRCDELGQALSQARRAARI